MLLDLVEVDKSHSGVNLAAAFALILDEFGIADKVSDGLYQILQLLTRAIQILSITCDNASVNDTMINELSKIIEKFSGPSNQTRCFNHILAIIAVRIVQQFDVPAGDGKDFMDQAERELRELAEGLDLEEEKTQRERDVEDVEESDDDEDDWVHEREKLSIIDREALDESIRPIRMLLVKVSYLFFDMGVTYWVIVASQDIFCVDPLHHDPLTSVVFDTRQAEIEGRQDASRREDKVELDVRSFAVCTAVSYRHRRHHRQ